MSFHILVAHGVNLDLLGQREPDIYGSLTLTDIEDHLRSALPSLEKICGCSGTSLTFFQTNNESELLGKVAEPWSGIVINPAAWTHTSLALADRLRGLGVPFVETHLSNIYARESFRHHSFTAPAAIGSVCGFGAQSYSAALLGLLASLAHAP